MSKDVDIKDHLANERTFLAWVRTGIGIMAFGFVVEKFALFVRQITLFLKEDELSLPVHTGYSAFFGMLLVGLGTLLSLFAYIKFKRVEKQIDEGIFRPSSQLDLMLLLSVLAIGIFLVIYLSNAL